MHSHAEPIEIAGGGAPRRVTPRYAEIADTFREQGAAAAELRRRGVEIFAGPHTNPSLNRRFIHRKDNNGFDVEMVQHL